MESRLHLIFVTALFQAVSHDAAHGRRKFLAELIGPVPLPIAGRPAHTGTKFLGTLAVYPVVAKAFDGDS